MSYKGGVPGFVRCVDDRALEFPTYDGNGQFRSLGNILVNPNVSLLFIDFESPNRLRIQGRANLGDDLTVRVDIDQIWPNCPRYIHRMRFESLSPHAPRDDYEPPDAEWKQHFTDVLPCTPALVASRRSAPSPRGGSPWPIGARTWTRSPTWRRAATVASSASPWAPAGSTCGAAPSAATSAAATARPTSTPPPTSTAPSHPLVQSFEPGEEWYWCYADEVGFEIDGRPAQPVPPVSTRDGALTRDDVVAMTPAERARLPRWLAEVDPTRAEPVHRHASSVAAGSCWR